MLDTALATIITTNKRLSEATGLRWAGWACAAILLFIPAAAAYYLLHRQEIRARTRAEQALVEAERASIRRGTLVIGRAQEALREQTELKQLKDQVTVRQVDTDAKYQGMQDRINNARTIRDLKKIRDELDRM